MTNVYRCPLKIDRSLLKTISHLDQAGRRSLLTHLNKKIEEDLGQVEVLKNLKALLKKQDDILVGEIIEALEQINSIRPLVLEGHDFALKRFKKRIVLESLVK